MSSQTEERDSIYDSEKQENQEYEKALQEQKKAKKPVARIIPAFIDFIIIGAQVVVFGGFMYMAYFYKPLGDKDCEADAYNNTPIAGIDTVGANVSLRFRMSIRWGFWLSLMNIGRSVLAQVALKIKSWFLLYFSYVLFAINFTTVLIWFTFANLWRFDHSGRVCAGDYLTPA